MRKILLSRPFISLFFQSFLVFTGANILNVLPDHLVAIGASKTYVGLFMNIGSLALVLLVVPLSHWTDRIGRKVFILAGYVTALGSTLAMFFLSNDLTAMMLLRIVSSLLFCATFTIHGVEAVGMLPRDRRMTGMAIFGISGLLSNPVSALLGEFILGVASPPWLFVASALLTALAMGLAIRYRFHKPAPVHGQASFFGLLKRPELWSLLVMTLMVGGAFSVFASFLANLTRERLGIVQISPFFMAFSFIAILLRLLVVPRLEKLPANLVAAICFVSMGAAFVVAWFLNAAWMLLPIGLLFGVSSAVLFPLLSTLIINSGTDEDRLGLNNLFASVNTLGNVLIAMVMGRFADWLGLPVVFLIMAGLVAVVVPVAWLGTDRKHRV